MPKNFIDNEASMAKADPENSGEKKEGKKQKISKFGAKFLHLGHEEIKEMVRQEIQLILADPFYTSELIQKQQQVQQKIGTRVMENKEWKKMIQERKNKGEIMDIEDEKEHAKKFFIEKNKRIKSRMIQEEQRVERFRKVRERQERVQSRMRSMDFERFSKGM